MSAPEDLLKMVSELGVQTPTRTKTTSKPGTPVKPTSNSKVAVTPPSRKRNRKAKDTTGEEDDSDDNAVAAAEEGGVKSRKVLTGIRKTITPKSKKAADTNDVFTTTDLEDEVKRSINAVKRAHPNDPKQAREVVDAVLRTVYGSNSRPPSASTRAKLKSGTQEDSEDEDQSKRSGRRQTRSAARNK